MCRDFHSRSLLSQQCYMLCCSVLRGKQQNGAILPCSDVTAYWRKCAFHSAPAHIKSVPGTARRYVIFNCYYCQVRMWFVNKSTNEWVQAHSFVLEDMYSLYVLGFSINRGGQTVKILFVKTRNLYGKSRVGKLKSRPWRVCSGNFGGRG